MTALVTGLGRDGWEAMGHRGGHCPDKNQEWRCDGDDRLLAGTRERKQGAVETGRNGAKLREMRGGGESLLSREAARSCTDRSLQTLSPSQRNWVAPCSSPSLSPSESGKFILSDARARIPESPSLPLSPSHSTANSPPNPSSLPSEYQ